LTINTVTTNIYVPTNPSTTITTATKDKLLQIKVMMVNNF